MGMVGYDAVVRSQKWNSIPRGSFSGNGELFVQLRCQLSFAQQSCTKPKFRKKLSSKGMIQQIGV